MKKKMKKNKRGYKWRFTPQQGKPGNCQNAQVWGKDGKSIAFMNATENEQEANDYAQKMSAMPELLNALILVEPFVLGATSNMPELKDLAKVIRKALKKALKI